MTRALDITLQPSRQRVLERVEELTRSDPALRDRLQTVKTFSSGVRSAEVFITNACNLRCKGCWFFEHDLDKAAKEVSDLTTLRTFAERLQSSGTTNVLLIGGEPALVPDRIAVFVETLPYVSVVSNGTRPVPYDGFENVQVFVSLWGGGPIDDQLRGHRPGGRRITGLFDLALAAYRNDPRVTWVYTVSEPGIDHIEPTVRAIQDNRNQVVFGFYSDYGADEPTGIRESDRLVAEMTRVWQNCPETVIGHPYYFDALVRGRTHWGTFGYDTCPSISVDHAAHTDRLGNGNPVLRGFNTYRADHTVQFCCTSGNCNGCRDSQAMWSWMLVNLHRFLDSTERLHTWVEMAENFYRQYYWSPYRPSGDRARPGAAADAE